MKYQKSPFSVSFHSKILPKSRYLKVWLSDSSVRRENFNEVKSNLIFHYMILLYIFLFSYDLMNFLPSQIILLLYSITFWNMADTIKQSIFLKLDTQYSIVAQIIKNPIASQFLKMPISHMVSHMIFVRCILSSASRILVTSMLFSLHLYLSDHTEIPTEEDLNSHWESDISRAQIYYRIREALRFSLIFLVPPQLPAHLGKVLTFIACSCNNTDLWNSICDLHHKYGKNFEGNRSFPSWCCILLIIIS